MHDKKASQLETTREVMVVHGTTEDGQAVVATVVENTTFITEEQADFLMATDPIIKAFLRVQAEVDEKSLHLLDI